jgi:hypothetical protein
MNSSLSPLKIKLLLLTPAAVLFLAASSAALWPPDWEPPYCGDGLCNSGETCSTCPDDCGACVPSCPLNDPDADFFVQQQYQDFLGRQPYSWELAQGVAAINSCYNYGDLGCANTQKVVMSRSMWEHPEFRQQSQTFGLANGNPPPQYNSWDFIYLSYSIYLRRAPNAPPDNGWSGFNFWKGVLDNCTQNDIAHSGNGSQCYNDIINAFLQSGEYRARFGCS